MSIPILNNTPFNLVLKQGPNANIALTTTYLQQGEPAYTTDSKQLYIGDGTNKNRIGLPNTSSTANPTTADLPLSGDASIHTNTTSGNVYLSYNHLGNIVITQIPVSISGSANIATANSLGIVQPDDSTIVINANGVISGTYSNSNVASYLPVYGGNVNASYYFGNVAYITGLQIATVSSTGVVQPDGNTISINSVGLISTPATISFYLNTGNIASPAAWVLADRTSNVITKCAVYITASDNTTNLTFDVTKNSISVFTAPINVLANTTPGNIYTFSTLTPNPLPINQNDIFKLNITSGTSNWQGAIQLEK